MLSVEGDDGPTMCREVSKQVDRWWLGPRCPSCQSIFDFCLQSTGQLASGAVDLSRSLRASHSARRYPTFNLLARTLFRQHSVLKKTPNHFSSKANKPHSTLP
ncbi:hypothetical protein CPB83DRAFT_104995 [Crepidotus variabilis]|uniref:Uncharacterized protein n=1 Tax=Crepidotus variabilis TaxID=179855 RepID=A0A9P6JS09_9AGAR|nr:hypothetical protein CPB83DRAFT_104995 [Crepidotus variabilis]